MPWESKKQSRWGHGKGGKEAGFSEKKIKEWDEKTDWDSLPEEACASSLAPDLTWATFSPDGLPDTLVDDVQEHADSVDNSQDKDGEARDHSYAGFLAQATNWDALLDTAGVPTDGTPPDPLKAQQQQEMLEDQMAQQLMSPAAAPSPAPGPSTPSGPSAPPSPSSGPHGLSPAPPGAQDRANQRRRAGRGVEGADSPESLDPMSQISDFDWDALPLSGQPPVG